MWPSNSSGERLQSKLMPTLRKSLGEEYPQGEEEKESESLKEECKASCCNAATARFMLSSRLPKLLPMLMWA